MIQTCVYELAHIAGQEIVEIIGGHALSLIASPGGMLLLMPQPPEERQVFEVHTKPGAQEESAVKLVEARWAREVAFGAGDKFYLVGVKALFEPRHASQQ
jgi:hypothetical protein